MAVSRQEIKDALTKLSPPIVVVSAGPVVPPLTFSWLNFADKAAADQAVQQLTAVPCSFLSANVLKPAPNGAVPIAAQVTDSDSLSASDGSSPGTSPRGAIGMLAGRGSRGATLFTDGDRLQLLHSDPVDPRLQVAACPTEHQKEFFMLKLANFIVTKTEMSICNDLRRWPHVCYSSFDVHRWRLHSRLHFAR